MTKPVDISAIGEKTGRDWPAWLAFLDGIGAAQMSHKDIAAAVRETGEASGWWAQTITVAYEQHIGRRAPGEMTGGGFQLSVTKTLPCSKDDALAAWLRLMDGCDAVGNLSFAAAPSVSSTDKWRYWRVTLADGSKVTITIADKAGGKAGLAVSHEKLASPEAVERWRAYWREMLRRL